MTKEEKDLLLIDLCARLPYGVIINCNEEDEMLFTIAERGFLGVNDRFLLEECKPYLRPMTSMTEEEKRNIEHYLVLFKNGVELYDEGIIFITNIYNKNHLDYRDLISKGLALEAPSDMYK